MLIGILSALLLLLPVTSLADEPGRNPPSSPDRIKEMLQGGGAHERVEAIKAAGRMGAGLQKVVDVLVLGLADSNPDVRKAAAEELTNLGPAASSAAPEIAKLLEDKEESVRLQAVEAIGGMAPLSKEALPGLLTLAKEDTPAVRKRALWTLGRFGPYARPAIPLLVATAQSKDEDLAVPAIAALGNIGPDAASAVPALLMVLQQDNTLLQHTVIYSLGSIGTADEKVVPTLSRLLDDGNAFPIREVAARSLGRIGPPAAATVPALLAIVKGNGPPVNPADLDLRVTAALALGRMGEAAQPAVKPFIAILRDKKGTPEVRNAVAGAFVDLGAVAKEALPDALDILFDPKDDAPRNNLTRLVAKAGKAAVPLLLERTNPKNDYLTRHEALELLGMLGPAAAEAIDPLSGLAQDRDRNIRDDAWRALRRIKKLE
jgi:HEAT repeat protein